MLASRYFICKWMERKASSNRYYYCIDASSKLSFLEINENVVCFANRTFWACDDQMNFWKIKINVVNLIDFYDFMLKRLTSTVRFFFSHRLFFIWLSHCHFICSSCFYGSVYRCVFVWSSLWIHDTNEWANNFFCEQTKYGLMSHLNRFKVSIALPIFFR